MLSKSMVTIFSPGAVSIALTGTSRRICGVPYEKGGRCGYTPEPRYPRVEGLLPSGFERRTDSVPGRTLRDICDEHVRGEIHFLKIDVEGAEAAVIGGADWRRYRPWVVLVEATEPLTDIASNAAWDPCWLPPTTSSP